MKTYSILNFDIEKQEPTHNDEIAFIKANNHIEALKKWWLHINASYYHTSKMLTFTYTAYENERHNINF